MGENTNIPEALTLIGAWTTVLADLLSAIGGTLAVAPETEDAEFPGPIAQNMQQSIDEMRSQLEFQKKQFQKQQIQMQLMQLERQILQIEQQLVTKKSTP